MKSAQRRALASCGCSVQSYAASMSRAGATSASALWTRAAMRCSGGSAISSTPIATTFGFGPSPTTRAQRWVPSIA
eukprot:9461920-Lingulodinium_polyedra.AAC.1